MKKIVVVAIALLSIQACCKIDDTPEDLPLCIVQQTINFSSSTCEGAFVAEYNFQHKRVFLFSDISCWDDGLVYVEDENCIDIGYLGGIYGSTKVNGEEFFKNAEFVRVIWHN